MSSKVLVTGYVPISGHPRSAKEYGDLGMELFPKLDCVGGDFTIHPFYETVGETWLTKLIQASHRTVSHSSGDNPAKNSLAYHCVQYQKFGWLLKAALRHPAAETFVWMDYGIGHVPGVTPAVVNDFMAAVQPNDFAIPGCWESDGLLISDFFPCWRFCGGLLLVPRLKVFTLYKAVKKTIREHIEQHNNIPWEVNTLAKAEQAGRIKPRWYLADHNETMFTCASK
jgi:hypothetical protein